MATDITLSNDPGYYANSVTVDVTWPSDANAAIVTWGKVPPVLSEVIAYDKGPIGPVGSVNATTSNVVRPFMAITQDGTGNVVYDGGFAKYFNSQMPNPKPTPLKNVLMFMAWCNPANNTGEWGVGNDAYYETFSNVPVKIASGDVLTYGMMLYGLTPQSGVDARVANGKWHNLRDYMDPALNNKPNPLPDTNGVGSHPGTDMTGLADGRWYYRTIPLEQLVGATLDQWRIAFEGDNPGWYTSYFREMFVKDRNGNIKAVLFNGTLTVPDVVGADEGDSGSYEQITKKVVDLSVFDQLPGGYKYLHNAMNYIANPSKVAAGNKKILVLGNVDNVSKYSVAIGMTTAGVSTDIKNNSFKDTLDYVASVAGYNLTYYTVSNSPDGKIDLRLSEFDKYCGVIFISSNYASTSADKRVTDACATDLSTYRKLNNGIMVISSYSDKGYTSPANAAATGTGYSRDANTVTQYTSSYFTNRVNRHPQSVEIIRQNLISSNVTSGKQLFDNMSNGDSIFAGDNEGMVVIDTYPNNRVPVNKSATYVINTPGENWLNILVQRKDGTVFVKPLKYTIINPDIYSITKYDNTLISGKWVTEKLAYDAQLHVTEGEDVTLIGTLYKNGFIQGYWRLENNVFTPHYFMGDKTTFDINDKDTIELRVALPYIYRISPITIDTSKRAELSKSNGTLAQGYWSMYRSSDYANLPTLDNALTDITEYLNKYFVDEGDLTLYPYWDWYNALADSFTGPLSQCMLWVTQNDTTWASSKPTAPTLGTAAIVASTNAVYYWDVISNTWVLHPQKASILFGQGRRVTSSRDHSTWLINANSTVPAT